MKKAAFALILLTMASSALKAAPDSLACQITAGGGMAAEQALWKFDFSNFYQTGGTAFDLRYRGNNTGEDISGDLEIKEDKGFVHPTGSLSEADWSNPPLSDSRYLFNRSHYPALQVLHRLDAGSFLRADIRYLNDRSEESRQQRSAYFSGEEPWVIEDSTILQRRSSRLQAALTYAADRPTYSLQNTLETHYDRSNILSDAVQSHNAFMQQYDLSDFRIRNLLDYKFFSDGREWYLHSLTGYFALPQNLNVQSQPREPGNRQSIDRKGMYTRNRGWTEVVLGPSVWRLAAELNVSYDNLASNLQMLLAPDSNNDLLGNSVQFALSPEYTFRYRRLALTAALPLVLYRLNINDAMASDDLEPVIHKHNKLYADPSARVVWTVDTRSRLSLQAAYKNTFGDIRDFTTAFLMSDYLHLQEGSGFLMQRQRRQYSVDYQYNDSARIFKIESSVFYRHENRNAIKSTGLERHRRKIVTTHLQMANEWSEWGGKLLISKTFPRAGISASLKAQYTGERSERLQQDILYPLQTDEWEIAPKITAKVRDKAVIAYEAKFTSERQTIWKPGKAASASSIQVLSQKLKAAYTPLTPLEIRLQAEYLYNEVSSSVATHDVFADAGLSYRFPRFRLSLDWSNIFNQQEYAYTTYNDLNTFRYSYRLRPWSVMATVAIILC
jgi:hypothetical protein